MIYKFNEYKKFNKVNKYGKLSGRKIEEIEFHNKREVDRNSLSDVEFEKKYSNKKVYKKIKV